MDEALHYVDQTYPPAHLREAARTLADEVRRLRPPATRTRLFDIRRHCCDTWPSPCTYHQGWLDGYEATTSAPFEGGDYPEKQAT